MAVEDEPRCGWPKTATTPETSELVQNTLSEHPSLTKLEIADTILVSDEQVLHILYEELCMKKLFGKLVQQKLTREQFSQHHLNLFDGNWTDLVCQFVIMILD